MTVWASAAAGLVLAAVLPSGVLFAFGDPEITESSGLVDRGDVVLTVNDSGSGPVLYGVDPASGDTVGRTTYTTDEVLDVEALAPGRGGTVWVGDIGDNLEARDGVTLYRVRPGVGTSARLDLAYPDGARDAEALLAHPRTGRLFVVSKSVFGATVYAVPPGTRPGSTTTMRRFAQVPGLVTDGAFLPDGRHVLLRSYGTATVYTFPGFERTGTVELPSQRQGEGVSVGADGRVLLSSEGVGAEVLEVELPAALTRPVAEPSASPVPSPAGRPESSPSPDGEASARGGMWSKPVAAALRVVIGLVMLTVLGLGLRRLWRA